MPEPARERLRQMGERGERLISVDDALARILSAFAPLPAIETPLLDALGLVLADDIVAPHDLPLFSNSAMDGYAVRSADTAGADRAQPHRLRIVDQIAAGHVPLQRIERDEAARIMTGAPMPPGADAVVRFEEVARFAGIPDDHDLIQLTRPVEAGANVRPAGEDLRKGSLALARRTGIRPQEIGLLAALGRSTVPVHRRPLVAVLSTGDELALPGETPAQGQIHDSNGAMVAAMAMSAGAAVLAAGISRDAVNDLSSLLSRCGHADLIITTGGVSHGDFDVVKDVLLANGEIALWQVRMRPGKPLAFGRLGPTPLLGLPGNPVAAAVSFWIFAQPAIQKMLGRRAIGLRVISATLTEPIENPGHRRHYVRALAEQDERGQWSVRTAGKGGSGILSSLTAANGLLVISEDIARAQPGTQVSVHLFDEADAALPLRAAAPPLS